MRGAGGFLFAVLLALCLAVKLLSGSHELWHRFSDDSLAATATASGYTTPSSRSTTLNLNLNLNNTAPSNYNNNGTCAAWLQEKFHCSELKCEDKVTGYFNYLDVLYCQIDAVGARVALCILMLVWVFFLLHIVETTTDSYFVTSLQATVNMLKLSPNIAGVTFLAVGNAACDVIASIAAINADSVDVGVGTTVGAGIFVTCGAFF